MLERLLNRQKVHKKQSTEPVKSFSEFQKDMSPGQLEGDSAGRWEVACQCVGLHEGARVEAIATPAFNELHGRDRGCRVARSADVQQQVPAEGGRQVTISRDAVDGAAQAVKSTVPSAAWKSCSR